MFATSNRAAAAVLVAVAAFAASNAAQAQLVTGLNRYSTTVMNVGSAYFGDRTFSINTMPAGFAGLEGIRTNNDDKDVALASWITFTLTERAYVYIAYDNRGIAPAPSWLADYEDTGLGIGVTDSGASPHRIYRRLFDAGPVVLPGNKAGTGSAAGSNYFVLLKGVPIFAQQPQTQVVLDGTTVSFTAELSLPVEPVTYQWQKDQDDLSGEDEMTLTIPNVTAANEGAYRCIVTDASGAKAIFISNEAELIVVGGPGAPIAGIVGLGFVAAGLAAIGIARARRR